MNEDIKMETQEFYSNIEESHLEEQESFKWVKRALWFIECVIITVGTLGYGEYPKWQE